MKMLIRFWNDEQGAVFSAELILITVLVVIGMVVGLSTFRDSLVQELGDTGAAVGQLNQSYAMGIGGAGNATATSEYTIVPAGNTVVVTFGAPTIAGARVLVASTFENYGYNDEPENCDGQDVAGQPPAGIVIGGMGAPSTASEASIPSPLP